MNILHIIGSSNYGGSPIHTLILAKETISRDHQVIIVCPLDGTFLREMKRSGIKILTMTMDVSGGLKTVFKLVDLVKKEQIDIIHSHEFKADILSCLVAKLSCVPVVTTIHNMINYSRINKVKLSIFIFLSKVISFFFDKILTVSEAVRANTINEIGIDAKKVITVLNGTDLKRFEIKVNNKEKKREFGINDASAIVGCIGRIALEQKGQKYLLEAANEILKVIPDVVFMIVGGDALNGLTKRRLEDLAQKLGISRNVIFTGWRNDIPEILSIIDVVAVPSLWEPLPRTVLEAMAMRKPVVGTSVHGIPEVIVDGETGFLVPPRNSVMLAKAILDLLKNKERIEAFGNAGYKRVKKYFTSRRHCEKTLNIYYEVINKHREKRKI